MTFTADLETLPHGPDSLCFQMIDPVRHRRGHVAVPPGVTAYAIGWLGETVESLGETPEACIGTLLDAYVADRIFSDGLMGSHTCEVCPPTLPQRGYYHPFEWNGRQTELYGHGHHLVLHGRALFVCPALILHYIVDHHYRPPEAFIEAVANGVLLSEDDCEFVPEDETRLELLQRHIRRWQRGTVLPRPFDQQASASEKLSRPQ